MKCWRSRTLFGTYVIAYSPQNYSRRTKLSFQIEAGVLEVLAGCQLVSLLSDRLLFSTHYRNMRFEITCVTHTNYLQGSTSLCSRVRLYPSGFLDWIKLGTLLFMERGLLLLILV